MIKRFLFVVGFTCLVTRVGGSDYKRVNELPFSEYSALRIMDQIGIAYPDIVLAQAKLETGNFTSKIFKDNKNMFGMRLPRLRKTTAIGEQYSHAKYSSWLQSIVDYKIWQDAVVSKYKSRRAYLKYLSENYAEDKKYIHKLKQMLQ